jgi:hypothetical protein
MSVGNDSVAWGLGQMGIQVNDTNVLATTGQTAALRVIGQAYRVIKSVANGSLVLGSRLSGEGTMPTIIINDAPANSIVVFCWPGENINGSLNGSLTIPAGQSGSFWPTVNVRGGPATVNLLDWRSAVLP